MLVSVSKWWKEGQTTHMMKVATHTSGGADRPQNSAPTFMVELDCPMKPKPVDISFVAKDEHGKVPSHAPSEPRKSPFCSHVMDSTLEWAYLLYGLIGHDIYTQSKKCSFIPMQCLQVHLRKYRPYLAARDSIHGCHYIKAKVENHLTKGVPHLPVQVVNEFSNNRLVHGEYEGGVYDGDLWMYRVAAEL